MAIKLTDTKLKALKPTGKVQKLSDGGGLYIHVSPAGGKLWRLFYRFDGKQKTLALGKYPDISLADARKLRDEARVLLAQGKTLPPTRRKPRPLLLRLRTWRIPLRPWPATGSARSARHGRKATNETSFHDWRTSFFRI